MGRHNMLTVPRLRHIPYEATTAQFTLAWSLIHTHTHTHTHTHELFSMHMALHSSPEPSSGAMNGNAHPQRQPAPPLPYFPAQLESPHSPSRPVLPPPSPLAPVLVRSSGLLAPPPPTPFWYPFSLSEQRPGAALEPHDGHDKMERCVLIALFFSCAAPFSFTMGHPFFF